MSILRSLLSETELVWCQVLSPRTHEDRRLLYSIDRVINCERVGTRGHKTGPHPYFIVLSLVGVCQLPARPIDHQGVACVFKVLTDVLVEVDVGFVRNRFNQSLLLDVQCDERILTAVLGSLPLVV